MVWFIGRQHPLFALLLLAQLLGARPFLVYDCSDIESKANYNEGAIDAAAELEVRRSVDSDCITARDFVEETFKHIPAVVQDERDFDGHCYRKGYIEEVDEYFYSLQSFCADEEACALNGAALGDFEASLFCYSRRSEPPGHSHACHATDAALCRSTFERYVSIHCPHKEVETAYVNEACRTKPITTFKPKPPISIFGGWVVGNSTSSSSGNTTTSGHQNLRGLKA